MFFGRRDVFLLSLLTFVTTVAWIVFDVYHSSVTTTISPEIEEKIVPITPTFDLPLVEGLKRRQKIDPFTTNSAGESSAVSTVEVEARAVETGSNAVETATGAGNTISR